MKKQQPRHRPQIFVTGHQRPDTDAAVSACVAARFKQRLDRTHAYEAIMLGEANAQTRWVFEQARVALPRIRADIRPTVGEQMERRFASIPVDANLAQAVELLHHARGSLSAWSRRMAGSRECSAIASPRAAIFIISTRRITSAISSTSRMWSPPSALRPLKKTGEIPDSTDGLIQDRQRLARRGDEDVGPHGRRPMRPGPQDDRYRCKKRK